MMNALPANNFPHGANPRSRLYTVPELIPLTGMTRKQVAYWVRIGLIFPTFHDQGARVGKPSSFYSETEVLKAMIICELRRAGFSIRQVRRVTHNLRDHGLELFEVESYLITDGCSVYYAYSEGEVVDLLREHRQMLLLLPIHEQVIRLQEVQEKCPA